MTGQNEKQNAVMVVYYIPSSKATRKAGLAWKTPHMMRRHGFVSFDGSVWFGHQDAFPAIDFSEVKAVGGRVQAVPFVEEQWDMVRSIARLGLERDIDTIRAALDDKVGKAQEKFAEATALQSVKGVKKAVGYLSNNLRLAKKRLNEAIEAATLFDLMGDAESLFDALRKSIAAHEETSRSVKETVKARTNAAKKNPTGAWGVEPEAVEMATA